MLPKNIQARISHEPVTGCWVWTGRMNRNGYGRAWFRGKEPVIHRVVWTVLVGPIPPGYLLDHLCRNRKCCNPAHLEPVTPQENTLRGEAVLFRPLAAALGGVASRVTAG